MWIAPGTGLPLTAPATLPTFGVIDDTGTATVAAGTATTNLGSGVFRSDAFAAVSGRIYTVRFDGDPLASGQVAVGDRFKTAIVDGDTEVANARVISEITAVRLAELDAANLPTDIASILATGGAGPWTTGAGASPAVVAAAVWSELLPGVFPGGSAGVILAGIVAALAGVDGRDLSELAGAGWAAGTDTLEEIRDAIDAIGGSGIKGHAVDPTAAP